MSFLLSDEASFITGGYLIDGGYTAVQPRCTQAPVSDPRRR